MIQLTMMLKKLEVIRWQGKKDTEGTIVKYVEK